MIESRLQTGHRRMMFSSQSSAQSTSSFSGGAETGIKRIVPHRGSVSDSDPPRSSPEAEPRLLKKIQLKEKYTFSPIASQRRFRRLAGYLRLCGQFDRPVADTYQPRGRAMEISLKSKNSQAGSQVPRAFLVTNTYLLAQANDDLV